MNRDNGFIRSLFAIFIAMILFAGSSMAEDYYGSAPGDTPTFQSANAGNIALSAPMKLASPSIPLSYCFTCLPTPKLAYTGKENYTVRGVDFIRYKLEVINRDDYPASLFKPAPTLPPCGLNKNSTRTWIKIYNIDGSYIYGFCALSSPSDMKGLWFAVARGTKPPKSVYLTMDDRACNKTLKSNSVTIS